MATLTRTNSGVNPTYKDYVNFLGGYKSGKKDNDNYPLTSDSSTSSLSSTDVTDFAKQSCVSYNSFLENSKNKKFSSVKPKLEEKTTKKSEIFIEIQEPQKSVSEVSKVFEKKTPVRSNSINSKISMFEKQISVENKPKISDKPTGKSPPPVKPNGLPPKPPKENIIVTSVTPPPPPPLPSTQTSLNQNGHVPPPPPMATNTQNQKVTSATFTVNNPNGIDMVPPPPPMIPFNTPNQKSASPPKLQATLKTGPQTKFTVNNSNGIDMVPPPPPMVPHNNTLNQKSASPPKLQATLKTGPQTKFTVNNPNGLNPNGIDRNDPMVKKLVYGTLRGLYGAYHDKASDMLATLPRNMVVRSNGVQDRIEQIAANGDLDKLNGRVNPKSEE